MDRDTLRQLQAFVFEANKIMNSIPLPVPPPPQDVWDGQLIDVVTLYREYNKLPAECQDAVTRGYKACLDVLEKQAGTAHAALIARYRLFAEIMETLHVSPEELVPNLGRESHLSLVPSEPDDEPDEESPSADEASSADEQLVALVRHEVEQHLETDVPANAAYRSGLRRLLRWYVGVGLGFAVASILIIIWQQFGPPRYTAPALPPHIATINRTASAGDMTMVLSYTEELTDSTRLHVQLFNAGTTAQSVGVAINHEGREGGSRKLAPSMVPARSTVHRVIELDKGTRSESVTVTAPDDARGDYVINFFTNVTVTDNGVP